MTACYSLSRGVAHKVSRCEVAAPSPPICEDCSVTALELRRILTEVLSKTSIELSLTASRHEGFLQQVLEQQEDIRTQVRALRHDVTLNCEQLVHVAERVEASPRCHVQTPRESVIGDAIDTVVLNEMKEFEEHERDHVSPRRKDISLLGRIVLSNYFETACMVIIIANTVYMGYHAQIRVDYARNFPGRGPGPDSDSHFIVEVIFFSCYCVEFVLKVMYWKLHAFRGPDGKATAFDGLLLFLNVIDLLDMGGADLMSLRIVKLASKLVKILRMGRLVKFCKELRIILIALTHSLRTFLWTVLALGIMMYLIAVIFVQGIADYFEEHATEADSDNPVLQHWGSIGNAMLTNYMAITAGQPWGEAAKTIQIAGRFYFWLWLVYIGMLTLSMLRVLTGILTQNAKDAVDRDNEETIQQNMWSLFLSIDEDQSGQISREEFGRHLSSKSAMEFMRRMQLNPVDLLKLTHLLDSGSDGLIDINEFVTGCQQVRGPAKNIDMIMQGHRVEDIANHLGLSQDALAGRMKGKHLGAQ